jgi:hypothetical protein
MIGLGGGFGSSFEAALNAIFLVVYLIERVEARRRLVETPGRGSF